MFVLVLAAEADETRQAITLLIVCLVGIAVMLAALTAWYWMFTSPKRRAGRLLTDLGHFDPSVNPGLEQLTEEAVAAAARPDHELAGVGAAGPPAGWKSAEGNIRIGAGRDVAAPPSPPPTRASRLAAAAGPSILSDSSDLLSQTLGGSPEADTPTVPAAPSVPAASPVPSTPAPARTPATPANTPLPEPPPATPPTAVPPIHPAASVRNAAAPVTVRRVTARPANSSATPTPTPTSERPETPRSTRIEVADRSAAANGRREADEVAAARQRRARRERDEAGLSDDDWAAVMKSAFNHLNR